MTDQLNGAPSKPMNALGLLEFKFNSPQYEFSEISHSSPSKTFDLPKEDRSEFAALSAEQKLKKEEEKAVQDKKKAANRRLVKKIQPPFAKLLKCDLTFQTVIRVSMCVRYCFFFNILNSTNFDSLSVQA